MDTIDETFSEDYCKRILKKGVLLTAVEDDRIIGVCFGTYNKKESWADLLGLVIEREFRKRGIGSLPVREFEKIIVKKNLKTIR